MLCIPFPIRKEHQWSLFPQLLPSLLDWWNWYRVSGCWTTMTIRYMHLLDTKVLLQAPSDLLGRKTTVICGFWTSCFCFDQSSFELLLHPAASQCQFEWQHERVLQALMCQGQHSLALRYFHITKPPISSTSQAKLSLSVLLQNR